MRTIEVYNNDTGEWDEVEWSTVTSGSKIRIYEESGDPVTDGTGLMEWDTVSDAYTQTISGSGDVWTVQVLDPSPRPITE